MSFDARAASLESTVVLGGLARTCNQRDVLRAVPEALRPHVVATKPMLHRSLNRGFTWLLTFDSADSARRLLAQGKRWGGRTVTMLTFLTAGGDKLSAGLFVRPAKGLGAAWYRSDKFYVVLRPVPAANTETREQVLFRVNSFTDTAR